ncbi:C2H2 transcription factor [Seiridium cupressi]
MVREFPSSQASKLSAPLDQDPRVRLTNQARPDHLTTGYSHIGTPPGRMAYSQDLGQEMEQEDTIMDEFSNFDPLLLWLDAQNRLPQADQMDCGINSTDYQQQQQPPPQAPMSPQTFQQLAPPEGYDMGLKRSPQSASNVLEGGYGGSQPVAAGFQQQGASHVELGYHQSGLLSPQSIIRDQYEGMCVPGPDDGVNRGIPQQFYGLLQNPAAYSPRLLPSAAEGAQMGAAQRLPPGVATDTEAAQRTAWAYAFDVVPADPDDTNVLEHLIAINDKLGRKRLADYRFAWTTSPAFGNQSVRRYILPERLRQDDRTRLLFMQVFNGNRPYNLKLPGYEFKMVQVFEPRQFHTPNDDYQAIAGLGEDDGVDSLPRFGDHDITDLAAYNPPAAPPFPSPEPHHDIDLTSLPAIPEQAATLPTPKDDADIHAAQRSKPIPKPERQVRKNAHGKYECTWTGCTEDVKQFNRKCEWNKHMDKHERPYKCLAEGCEKLAGFTYSGGLLRHEREVHDKHGGPRNPLNCPHVNCKRHAGKGFSRLENLNEHLRRVHTNPIPGASGDEAGEDGDSVAASESGQMLPQQIQYQPQQPQPQPQPQPQITPVVPQKRPHEEDETDLRSEVKRLRKSEEDLFQANADLIRQLEAQKHQAEVDAANQKQELEAQKRQIMAMMADMTNMRQQLGPSEQQHQSSPLLDDAFP